MKWIFWGSIAFVSYAYIGYPAFLWMRNRWRPIPVSAAPFFPTISIVLVVRNEAAILERKLNNLESLHYPPGQIEIIVVSDGSTDQTNHILKKFARSPARRVVIHSSPLGKASGLNSALSVSSSEIVVFTDVRQQIEMEAIRLLLENFADPSVGCASGELMLGDQASEVIAGVGLYWKMEKKIREMESSSGSVVGATGALYAVRRSLVPSLPSETILDDVYIPMSVVRQGWRVVFDKRARAWDLPDLGRGREFTRKVRTLSGNYQLLQLAPWLLGKSNPLRFNFVSHKLVRLFVPLALIVCFLSSFFIPSLVYRMAMASQLAFYAVSLWALLRPFRGPLSAPANAGSGFLLLNTAALVALANTALGRKVTWYRP